MTGTGRDPTTCRNTPEQRRYQLVYQRARGRAVTALIAAHEAEWEHLFAAKRAEVQAEVDAVDEAGADHYGTEPTRLKTGRRKQGQTVVDRIDVARCPHCIKHHDRGHACPKCGAAPTQKTGRRDDGVFDEVAIQRRMDGDKDIPLTKPERTELVRRCRKAGWSYRDIEALAGVPKAERYIEREGATG